MLARLSCSISLFITLKHQVSFVLTHVVDSYLNVISEILPSWGASKADSITHSYADVSLHIYQ